MAMRRTIYERASIASARVFMVIRIARSDGIITEAEAAEIEREAERSYRLNETASAVRAFCNQADRIGYDTPNQPMAQQLKDVLQLWEQTKGSKSCEDLEPDEAA